MANYILLMTLTPDGQRAVLENPGSVAEACRPSAGRRRHGARPLRRPRPLRLRRHRSGARQRGGGPLLRPTGRAGRSAHHHAPRRSHIPAQRAERARHRRAARRNEPAQARGRLALAPPALRKRASLRRPLRGAPALHARLCPARNGTCASVSADSPPPYGPTTARPSPPPDSAATRRRRAPYPGKAASPECAECVKVQRVRNNGEIKRAGAPPSRRFCWAGRRRA